MPFVHLHNHSFYSLLDGLPSPKSIVEHAKKQGSTAVAITDHGTMYAGVEFYKEAKAADVHPVIGCEVYVAKRKRFDKESAKDMQRYHLTLLAMNEDGYKNLLRLTTHAYLEGMYYKPRVDWDILKKYNSGLIAMSGCLQGEVPQAILNGDEQKARELIEKLQKTYGKENFYLEIQDHPKLAKQIEVNNKFIELHNDMGVPLVATADSHYLNPDDAEAHDIMLCIQTNSHVDEEKRFSMMNDDFSMKDPKIIQEAFAEVPAAMTNTEEIAKRCKVDFQLGVNLIPAFPLPPKKKANEYLRELCIDGIVERYAFSTQKEKLLKNDLSALNEDEKNKMERLNYELETIHKMGFDTYFLIVWDFIKYAKDQGITVGPGRGSAAGSIVSYCLKITDLDPMQHQLLFERFLNPARVSMPDIDMDFADNRRDEVIEYVTEKYGKEHVAQISTFGTMAARAAVKDVGRALGVPFAEMNSFAKLIPERPGTKLKEALDTVPELQEAYTSTDLYKKIVDIALKLEGTVRHVSVHACAVVIANEPLYNYTALQHPPKDDKSIITQYSAKPLEALGLLKMDFLGLKNLTIIQKAINIIRRTKGTDIDISKIPPDDGKAFELFARGDTTGVFQFESGGMKRYLKQLKPTEFEDIIAMAALYRPGPMDWIPKYIKSKHSTKAIKYVHKSLEPYLKSTYGVAVYQEQVMEIAQEFSDMPLGEAYLLLKGIAKKIPRIVQEQKAKFINGAIKKGHEEKTAKEIFEKVIEPFAGYGFNKSHSACYALIAYQTAYLKAHYPAEFMAALMSCDADNLDRIYIEIKECYAMGISVLPADVNESMRNFTVVEDGKIRFGLSAIKGVGAGPIDRILETRGTQKFKNLDDFVTRIDQKVMNKKTCESLVKSGALDSLGERNQLLENFETISEFAKNKQVKTDESQMDMFGTLAAPPESGLKLADAEPASRSKKLAWEKEFLGMYISSHPLAGLKKYLQRKYHFAESLKEKDSGKIKTVGGLVVNKKKIITKKQANMMIMQLEDPTGQLTITVFPRIYKNFSNLLEAEEGFLSVTGKLDIRNGEFQIIADAIKKINLELMRANAREANMFDEEDTGFYFEEKEAEPGDPLDNSTHEESPQQETPKRFSIEIPENASQESLHNLKTVLSKYPGDEEVVLFIKSEKNTVKVPLKVTPSDEMKKEVKKVWAKF